MRIIRAQGGTGEKIVDVSKAQYPGVVPDLWHVAMELKDQGNTQASEMVLDCWHLAHDMLGALLCIEMGADITEPIPTKPKYMSKG